MSRNHAVSAPPALGIKALDWTDPLEQTDMRKCQIGHRRIHHRHLGGDHSAGGQWEGRVSHLVIAIHRGAVLGSGRLCTRT